MDETYITILNDCIDIVEELLINHSIEGLPHCRIGLYDSPTDKTSVWCVRGTEANPALHPDGCRARSVLIKDTDEFSDCWRVLAGHARATASYMKLMKPGVTPTFDRMDFQGAYAMPVEILCRGITKSLSPESAARMFGGYKGL
jgi:hypothetical protein